MSTTISCYSVSKLEVEFITDDDPMSRFLRIRLYSPETKSWAPTTLTIWPENAQVADRLHDLFLASQGTKNEEPT